MWLNINAGFSNVNQLVECLDAKFALENDFAEPLYAESVGDTVSIFTDTK